MQTDKDLFNLIKETYPLTPRKEFTLETSNKLRQGARKLNRKRRIKQLSFASTSIAMCTLAISWLFYFGGTEILSNSLNHFEQENSSATVKKQKPLVYIYQSHNLESFLPETNTNTPDGAFHETENITLVGERLSQSLKDRGINSIHDKTDFTGILNEQGLSASDAYKVSREPLEDAIRENKTIKMVFDIHRDSRGRNDTTIKIDGKGYSKVAFVLSKTNANYEENLKFAELLHQQIEEKYPRLSRGVILYENPSKPKTFNQDLTDNSVLVEIGGVENTLEEEYRTVDVLAEIIQDLLEQSDI
ncbi:stage II sporulation protein P [Cytobacillus sp. FSL R5-0596]|uniref:stage II sporulation protein P n=1 Tax=Cytobacillus sp. FSL R5-0596 TaxID=2954696 RepID=UPI0030F9B03F